MSSSDGLHRLTEYLAQTRRQANAAIDVLNKRVEELELSNSELRENEKILRLEKDDLQVQLKLLKAENSTKFQLRERDDWKAVLDSVQKDRQRLSEECEALKKQLDELQSEQERLQTEMEVHSGKLILGMTQNNEASKEDENVEDTSESFSAFMKLGTKQAHEEYLNRFKKKLVSKVVLLNRASEVNSTGRNTSNIILSLWHLIFGGDQMEDTKPTILIV